MRCMAAQHKTCAHMACTLAGVYFVMFNGLIHELVVLLRISVQAAVAPYASDVSPYNGLFCNVWNIQCYIWPGPQR